MTAGTLAGTGYFMGERLHQPRPSNPKGFYEDIEVNAVNEAILTPATPWTPPLFRPGQLYRLLRSTLFRGKPGDGQRWLARIPLNVSLVSSPEIDTRIRALVGHQPYCFKDPRFCYTLPIWRPWLQNTCFVCVFRDPTISAKSMLQESHTMPKLAGLKLTYADCLEVWRLMYLHVLDIHSRQGEWLFLHYDQMLDGSGLEKLAEFLGAAPDWTFPDSALRRTQPRGRAPDAVCAVYEQLCHRAGEAD